MTAWAIIPIRPEGEGKSRLAAVLSAAERTALAEDMLRHVVAAATQASGIGRIFLVGPMRRAMPGTVDALSDPGTGLNGALAAAMQQLSKTANPPRRVVIIAADLPGLTALDLEMLCAVPEGAIGIAPDRYGTGTNALSLPFFAAAHLRFKYGGNSAALHAKEADRLGLAVETIRSPGLEKDIDEPGDLIDAPRSRIFGQ